MNRKKLLIIGSPFPHYSRESFLKKLTKIVNEIYDEVHVIGANEPEDDPNIEWFEYSINKGTKKIERNILFFNYQIASAQQSVDYDHIIIRDAPCFLSSIILRIKNSSHSTIITQKTQRPLVNAISRLTMYISDELIVESPSVLNEWGGTYKDKTQLGATYVDTTKYSVKTAIPDRSKTIGYLGIIRERKGIPSLLESAQKISDNQSDLSIKIAGDGPSRNQVINIASKTNSIKYLGFIDHSEITDFYNSLRLFILPTESEGLPNVALEAMACGTPVLATSVGGIPDLIDDGINGFLMDNNSPKIIEQNIYRALNHDLTTVSENARDTIVSEYRFPDAVERYKSIL